MLIGKPSLMRWLMRVLLLAWALTFAACASTSPEHPKLVDHSFSFDGWFDNWAKNVDLLAYSYGDQYRMVRDEVKPPKERLGPSAGVNGPMPVGEFLYVKWRIKATGEVLEDKVDLRPLLPKPMTDYELTFVPDGRQLFVYLVTPTLRTGKTSQPLPTYLSRGRETYEIYPHNTFPPNQR